MPIKTKYDKLLEEEGREAANAYMKKLRSKVKNHKGLNDMSPERRKEISAMGVEARRLKRGN